MALPATISSHERIIGPKELEIALTLQYTAPGPRKISDIYLTSGANARTVNLYIVPVGETPQSSNKLLNGFSTIANDLRPVIDLNYSIKVGERIYTDCSGDGTNLVIIAYR